jgi:hypothetical protein
MSIRTVFSCDACGVDISRGFSYWTVEPPRRSHEVVHDGLRWDVSATFGQPRYHVCTKCFGGLAEKLPSAKAVA